MQVAEFTEDDLADNIRSRLQSRPGPGLVPRWTTRRASRALSGELGRHDGAVRAVAVLADGRVVTGGTDRRVLTWDPVRASTEVIQLGCSLIALATTPPGPARSDLVIAHEGSGFSLWSFTG
jgi:hypothetical protein